jgi:5-formyltetrahydrofolate cyclo-ligase
MNFKPINTIHFDYGYWKSMREPTTNTIIHSQDISVMLVPIIAFNKSNHRLGYGLNFYNNFLQEEQNIYTIGLAYDFQLNNEFTTTKKDKPLDVIITN